MTMKCKWILSFERKSIFNRFYGSVKQQIQMWSNVYSKYYLIYDWRQNSLISMSLSVYSFNKWDSRLWCLCVFFVYRIVFINKLTFLNGGGMTQWIRRLTRNQSVVSLHLIKSSCCFLRQETFTSLLSTGWFQEQTWTWFHNQTKIDLGLWGSPC